MAVDEPYPEVDDGRPLSSPDARLQEGRWRTTSVTAPVEAVREAFALAIRRRKSLGGLVVSGVSSRHGFVLRCTSGKKTIGAELELAGWEAGTQVHLVVPQDERPTEADLAKVAAWVHLVLGAKRWRVE